jgi:hypothetical protein
MAVLIFIVLALITAAMIAAFTKRSGGSQQLQDAAAETRRWVDRLGAGVTGLSGTGNPAATQALADAAERHNAASVQLTQARTPGQFALASQTAIEGLHYIRAARTALNMDPGPAVPALAQTEPLTAQRHVFVGNQEHMASPHPGDATPYYYPGGTVSGRPVPAGWYSTPWWKTALVAGAAGMGGALLMDTLLDGFHHHAGGFLDGPGGLF